MKTSEKQDRKMAGRFYTLTADPEGCHETKADHVLSKLKEILP